jgi:hypothetical protein
MMVLVVEKFRNEMYQVLDLKVGLGHATSMYAVSMVNGKVENRHECADGEERRLLQMTEAVVGRKRAQWPFSTRTEFSLFTAMVP